MNINRLHITNGDCVAELLKNSSIHGEVLPWRDPMHHGPFHANLDLDAISAIRAVYLAGNTLNKNSVKQDFHLRNTRLRNATQYEEIVLWFEHDLLDQLQILQLLDWFSKTDIGTSLLSIICIDNFPGISGFQGLGQLNSEQLESLLPTRKPVSPAQLQLATAAWEFFCSENPEQLEKLIHSDTSLLPFLSNTIQRHFQEYVWTSDGLTRTERQILTLVSSGALNPGQVFTKNMDLEDALYIGDWSTYRTIARLCELSTPLLSCAPDNTFRYPPEHDLTPDDFQQQMLSLTNAGHAVLAGTRNANPLFNRNEWLGGVHITSNGPMWMWDDVASQLTLVTR